MPHRSSRAAAISAAAVALLSVTFVPLASGGESPMQFFLEQQRPQQTAPSPMRHRAPAFVHPHAPRMTVERHPAMTTTSERRPLPRPVAMPVAHVMIYGDRFAQALAGGIAEQDASGVAISSVTVDDAGLTRPDFDAWLESLRTKLKSEHSAAVAIMMVGAADLGPMTVAGVALDPSSDRWKDAYGRRVEAVAAAFEEAKVPLIWVGLPSVRDPAASAGFVRLNSIVRDAAERRGATPVDVWEAFSDDAGRYSAVGPDVEGDTVKLRRADGMGFTHAGARKLASFVIGDVKRLSASGARPVPDASKITIDRPSDFDQALDIDINAQIRREAGLPTAGVIGSGPLPAQPAAGPTISLDEAPLAPGGELAGATSPETPRALTAASGSPAEVATGARPGRADDFAWPKP